MLTGGEDAGGGPERLRRSVEVAGVEDEEEEEEV